ncbi:hypothetical protein BAUCODRAFT_147976 [Baudoinia panamericana UAMH 10762]|uniref:Apc15p protein-domain-containing protein n=1 Tax=Baudoinia panamericana (strain UAMH 10762) TaxID=717646 RepID=M2NB20_BAUPA|nr:uncharacterized protein BAUCODRAFT_147976 [Baudoinia panamericana UAMH 10762]EMC96349.1 hypothetical protein BAUCODRAFT_147976 [Baudoinia panamericana UAMH 10762]
MLSIPLIPPPFDSTPILPTAFRPRPESPPPHQTTLSNNPQHTRLLQQRRDEERKAHNARSPLALLNADEAAIAARKAAIRNFGSYWIRPPGVPKTLQATNEEAAERAEAEEAERQQAGLRDMEAQQQIAEAREQAQGGGGEGGEVERDLDEEIPDAAENEVGEVSFNEESLVEGGGSMVAEQHQQGLQDADAVEEEEAEVREALEMEEAELTGVAQEEAELGIERDLDDSVPEAGSYQHTDTEVEDSDSDSDLQDSFAIQSARRSARATRRMAAPPAQFAVAAGPGTPLQAQVQSLGALQERMRAHVGGGQSLPRSPGSLNLSSSLLESSFVGSSPVLQRGGRGGRARPGRRRGARSS